MGYYRDDATGTFYIRARVYEPVTGRWLSQDPLFYTKVSRLRDLDSELVSVRIDTNAGLLTGGTDGDSIGLAGRDANLFLYVGNDPTNLSDPRGLIPLTKEAKKELCVLAGKMPHIHKGSGAGVICFDGEKISCSWQESLLDKELDEIIERCFLLHEDTHHDDVPDCPRGCWKRMGFKKSMGKKARDKEECDGYLEELKCFQKALDDDECKTLLCKNTVQSKIEHIKGPAVKSKHNCTNF